MNYAFYKQIVLGTLAIFLFAPGISHAAKLYVETSSNAAKNTEARLEVRIDTQGEVVNALSGEIVIPKELEVSKIYDGDSAVVLWVEKPTLREDSHKISFSGLTPGGISGNRPLFSFFVKGDVGVYSLQATNVSIFKNDGQGSPVKVTSPTGRLTIKAGATSTKDEIIDTEAPEPFTPIISETTELLDSNPFISFSAQDKGVGIDHYEFAVKIFGSPATGDWGNAESPLVLSGDMARAKIFIKAIDKVGNERTVSIAGPTHYTYIATWSIIILLIITCALYFLKRFFL